MKKIIIALLVVVALAAVGLGFYFKRDSHGLSVEEILPADPVFYARATNISQRVERFTATKFWQDLKVLDYNKVAAKMGVAGDSLEFKQKMSEIFSSENQAILKALLGKEVAIAVYVDGNSKDFKATTRAEAQKSFLDMASNLFIVTRVGPEVKAAEIIAKLGGQFNKDIAMSTTQYKGKAINLITSKDGSITFGYVRLNDFVVMGVGEKAAHNAIDVITKAQKSLSQSESFLKRKKSFGDDADTIGFFEMQTVYHFLQEQMKNMSQTNATNSPAMQTQLEEQFKQTQGLEAIVFASKSGDILTGKVDLYYDPAQLHADVRSFYTCAPSENNSAKFVPWDALFYQWMTCMDFTVMWKHYKTQLETQAKLRGNAATVGTMINTYEQMLGLKIEGDILPALGKEFGMYLTDLDMGGNIPVPKLVVFVQTTGRAKGEAIINKLFSLQPMLKPQEEQYSGEVIKFIPIPLASSFKVGYTFVGDYLLLATNVDVLKASLDAAKNPDKSIHINSSFQTAGVSVGGSYNSLFFTQVDRVTQKASALVDWSSAMAKENAEQSKAFLAGSKKNLTDIISRKEQIRNEIKASQGSIDQLEKTPVDPAADLPARIETLKKLTESQKKELATTEEKEKNLKELITSYETRAPKTADNQEVADQFIKPLLGALSNIKFFVTTSINQDGVFGSTSYLKME